MNAFRKLAPLLFVGIASAQQITSRDLVGVKPEWREYSSDSNCNGLAGGSGGGIGGSGSTSPNATLEIIGLNGSTFQRKDEVIVTVRLVNSGKQDFWIPWQEHPFEFEPDDGAVGHFKALVLHMMAVDSSSKEKRIVSLPVFSHLFSASEVGPTQLQLKPGESAQVRFAARLDCEATNCWADNTDTLELRAHWWIEEETIDRRKKCLTSSISKIVDGGESKGFTIAIQKLETRN